MNKIKKYIPIMVEFMVFSLCFVVMVYIENIKVDGNIQPIYITMDMLPTPTKEYINNNEEKIEDEQSEIEETEPEIEQEQPEIKEEVTEEVKQEPIKQIYSNNYDVSTAPVLKTYTATVSYYGPDCGGCTSGYTASGYYIGKRGEQNNIYYTDQTYGQVKIVAADNSIPFGTILNLNINGKNNLAIVLDRGDIGFDRKFQFDLLVENEALSYQLGVSYNTKVDVLRYGY